MKNIAIRCPESQEEKANSTFQEVEHILPSGEEFFDIFEQQIRQLARITIIRTIEDEFNQFIGAAPYQRSEDRADYRNGVRYRAFDTRFGTIEDIPIPRSRSGLFFTKLFSRWKRREKKITRLIADIFINGVSTRKVKNLTKTIWGRAYSASSVSRCNRVLQEEYIKWMNKPIKSAAAGTFS